MRMDYFVEFASTYAYLATMRIEAEAQKAGVALTWRPFLLGPIFAAQGWNNSPFNLYPAKGRFMFRDMERRAAALNLPFKRGEGVDFPVNSLVAARWALAALTSPQGPAFCRAVHAAHWGQGRDIAKTEVLADCARAVGLDPAVLAAAAPEQKAALRANTDAAMALGVFGAPSFVVYRDGAAPELFWGEDQLTDALHWAQTGRLRR